MTRLRTWLRLILVAKTTALFFLIWCAGRPMLFARPALRLRLRRFIFGTWARTILRVMRVEVEVVGSAPRPPFLLAANHLSYFDIVVLASRLDAVFVSKSDVRDWPLLGFMVRQMDTIFVDRNQRRDIPRVVAAIERALDAGDGVVVFPEGTSTSGASVAPFRPSLLEPAPRTGLPVIAAALGYKTPDGEPPADLAVCWWGDMTFADHFLGMLALPRFSARVAFADDPVEDDDRKRLAERLESRVRELFVPVAGAVA